MQCTANEPASTITDGETPIRNRRKWIGKKRVTAAPQQFYDLQPTRCIRKVPPIQRSRCMHLALTAYPHEAKTAMSAQLRSARANDGALATDLPRSREPFNVSGAMHMLLPTESETIRRIVAEHKARPGPLLEVLHGIQDALGYVPEAAVPLVADGLNLSRAEVHGVVTFYHHFRSEQPGRHVVRLCRAEACQSMGADALADHARRVLGVDFHETTPDGRYSLEAVYCLGNCACSPAVMIDDRLCGRVTRERFDALIAQMERSDK